MIFLFLAVLSFGLVAPMLERAEDKKEISRGPRFVAKK